MEALGAVLRRGSSMAARSDDDHLYEDIEAPKFVDFTVPDRSRADDRSWFCARIGCDQSHEEVDPDALYKSFVLRVMAARSPNVRLQKALSRQQATSAIAKCPRSAPAKSAKCRATKLGVLGSMSEKMRISSKLKVHPIASLRSTPNHGKVAKRPPTSKKAMTSPRNRMRPPNEEPFRSAKNSKVRAPAPKSRTVVKALTFQTPKKEEHAAASAHRTPIQELSAGLKKIRIGANPGISGSEARAQKPMSKVRGTPMDQDACRDQPGSESETCCVEVNRNETCCMEVNRKPMEGKDGEEREPLSSVRLGDQPGLEFTSKPEGNDPQEKLVDCDVRSALAEERGGKEKLENSSSSLSSSDFDENKENAVEIYNTNRDMDPSTNNNGTENCQNKNSNIPQKATVVPSKALQEQSLQGVKYKALKPTNPKPFRLRTDERGILREANMGRGKPQKETPVIKTQGRTKRVSTKPGRPDEPEMVPSTQTKPMGDCEEKSTRKTQNKSRLPASRRLLKPQSVTESENASISLLGGGKKEAHAATLRPKERACRAQAENSTTTTTMSPQVKKAITIPKEPVFHKINIPKGCTKRLEKVN